MKADKLSYEVRKDIEQRAQKIGVSVERYLEDADKNYCILLKKNIDNFFNQNQVLCDRDGVVIYGSKKGAQQEIDNLALWDDAEIITESEQISIACQNELNKRINFCGFEFSQTESGSISIRMVDALQQIKIVPVCGNVIEIGR